MRFAFVTLHELIQNAFIIRMTICSAMNAVSAVKAFSRNQKRHRCIGILLFLQKMKILSEKGDKI